VKEIKIMGFKRFSALCVGAAVLLTVLLLVACGGGETDLDGTWTLETVNGTFDDVGSGTYSIAYSTTLQLGKVTFDYFAGDGIIGGQPYKVSVERRIGSTGRGYYLYLYENTKADSIKFEGDLNGGVQASGNYSMEPDDGSGTYGNFGTGTFVTNKQE
jgi:hypothetical protein